MVNYINRPVNLSKFSSWFEIKDKSSEKHIYISYSFTHTVRRHTLWTNKKYLKNKPIFYRCKKIYIKTKVQKSTPPTKKSKVIKNPYKFTSGKVHTSIQTELLT